MTHPLARLPGEPAATAASATPAHKRFHTLLRQVTQARTSLADWEAHASRARTAHAAALHPLEAAAQAACRRWVLALDRVGGYKGWTPRERATLTALLVDTAAALLESEEFADDPDLRAVLGRHGGEPGAVAPSDAPEQTPTDGAANPTRDADADGDGRAAGPDPADTTDPGERPAPGRRAGTDRPAPRTPPDTHAATRSVREVYRRLASALHPDREPDAHLRERKTALMQRANHAHDQGDLLGLLELQWALEPADPSALAAVDGERLGHYNRVLADQLERLKGDVAEAEAALRHEFGISPWAALRPDQIDAALQHRAAELRQEVAMLEDEADRFRSIAETRHWLKGMARRGFRPPAGRA